MIWKCMMVQYVHKIDYTCEIFFKHINLGLQFQDLGILDEAIWGVTHDYVIFHDIEDEEEEKTYNVLPQEKFATTLDEAQ